MYRDNLINSIHKDTIINVKEHFKTTISNHYQPEMNEEDTFDNENNVMISPSLDNDNGLYNQDDIHMIIDENKLLKTKLHECQEDCELLAKHFDEREIENNKTRKEELNKISLLENNVFDLKIKIKEIENHNKVLLDKNKNDLIEIQTNSATIIELRSLLMNTIEENNNIKSININLQQNLGQAVEKIEVLQKQTLLQEKDKDKLQLQLKNQDNLKRDESIVSDYQLSQLNNRLIKYIDENKLLKHDIECMANYHKNEMNRKSEQIASLRNCFNENNKIKYGIEMNGKYNKLKSDSKKKNTLKKNELELDVDKLINLSSVDVIDIEKSEKNASAHENKFVALPTPQLNSPSLPNSVTSLLKNTLFPKIRRKNIYSIGIETKYSLFSRKLGRNVILPQGNMSPPSSPSKK